MRHVAKLMVASAFTALLATTAQTTVALAQTPKDTVVMAKQIDDIISLDPAEAFEFSGVEVVTNLYDKLMGVDLAKNNELVPELAQSWSVTPDNLTYTFKLRPGVKFHSGNPLTAADVVYSFQRAVTLNKSPGFILAQFGFTKDNVTEKVKATDDSTLVITVSKPFAPTFFLNCLTSGVASIVDSKLVKANEKDGDWGNGWLKQNSAGSGAYKVRAYRPNEQYALDANESWYKGAPKNKRIIVRHVAEPASQRLLLEKGDIDIARNLSKDQLTAVKANKDIELVQGDKGYILYLGLNTKNPNFAKPEVREALKYLVDYASIERNIVEGTYKAHQSFLPKGFLGAIDDKPYTFNPAKAKELLAKAGLPNGFSVTMDVRSRQPDHRHRSGDPVDLGSGRHQARADPGRRQADADQVPRPHPRYLYRPVGPGLSRPAHQCGDLRHQREQQRGREVEDAGLAQRLGHPRDDQDHPGQCARAGRRQARRRLWRSAARAPEGLALRDHVPAGRGLGRAQERQELGHRAELGHEFLRADRQELSASHDTPRLGRPAAAGLLLPVRGAPASPEPNTEERR